MAVAKSSSINETLKLPCICYKVASLSETILETDQAANLNDGYVLEAQSGWGQFGVIGSCLDKLTREVQENPAFHREDANIHVHAV
ncbi:hypothetical protein REPUB_Repub05bG0121100 [Reevesia pubescens]